MAKCIESGPLRGRPYGGVMTLVKQNLGKIRAVYILVRSFCYIADT